MPFNAPNHNRLWANLIVEELVRQGVTQFYIAPGSRSTPLVTAVADHGSTSTCIHYDERGTSFLALGYGRATGRPAVWITTSGTALANGLPAVVEAYTERIPMLLLTADRPPELRATGANQTIRQPGIFGSYTVWDVDLPAPDVTVDPAFVLTTMDQAAARSRSGPVHVNCMFREPLAPERVPFDQPSGHRALDRWKEGSSPYTEYGEPLDDPAGTAAALDARLRSAERPMILLGRMTNISMLKGALESHPDAEALNIPILADITSQARLGAGGYPFIPAWDAILYNKGICDRLEPDLVLQFGRAPVSKRVHQFLEAAAPREWIVVSVGKERIDPRHRVSRRETAVPEKVFAALLASRKTTDDERLRTAVWRDLWRELSDTVGLWQDEVFSEDDEHELTEQRAACELSRMIPASTFLSLGSSTPVRHMDIYASSSGARVPVCANRGASGIDGTLATAAGYADGSARRAVVFLGDLATLHDLNSLKLIADRQAVVIVLNNDGGGIFSYLPIRRHGDVFEQFFGTPHGLTFERVAEMFGLAYDRPVSVDDFRTAFEQAIGRSQGTIMEVRTNRLENYEEQRRLLVALSDRTGGAVRRVLKMRGLK